jgi:hypothetical protein
VLDTVHAKIYCDMLGRCPSFTVASEYDYNQDETIYLYDVIKAIKKDPSATIDVIKNWRTKP